MIEIPTGLPSELVPLSWLIGVWEGTGVIDYTVGDTTVTREFGQRVSFSHDGLPYLNYNSYTWLLPEQPSADATGESTTDADALSDDTEPAAQTPDAAEQLAAPEPLVTETGYWRLERPLIEGDPGPGMLPGTGPRPFGTAQAVETLRTSTGAFPLQVSIVHPNGVSELYLGRIEGPRIDLATDAVVRTAGAKEYAAATRLYGLVDNHLLWAWDIAALGQDLRTHASARLAKAD
ncbi:MAG TPA: FABP family protein [Plantibacter sp.]|uniref:FABP family protein n=1 Tax=unclassified Plantibacter TaxID=2624265 RepID=UPI002C92E76D|nr:FABP family protein [Plantibacter sp.]